MKIYVVIELIEYCEDDPKCHIIFSSENKQACIDYFEYMKGFEQLNDNCQDYFYYIDEIQL